LHFSPSSPAQLVHEFHLTFGLDTRTTPTEVSPELAAHRGELLAEEAAEVAEVAVAGPLDRLGPDGRVSRRADGKVLKGDHYRAPDVSDVLRNQGWEPRSTV
jgi:predicted HAD superfamily Cof-like phosphohydrolase